jgi:acetylornithine/succinyldiaminopimelate/putrescine aminotransferase
MTRTHRQLFLEHVAQTSPAPLLLEIERARGVYLYGPAASGGKEYIDLIAGISVSSLGHCHPAVVQAVQHQAETFMHLMVYGEFVHSPQVKLAEALTAQLPDSLNSVYLVNSGAEATEGALKLAKRYTGRPDVVHFANSYHGSTQGALSVIGSEYFRNAYRPLIPGSRMLQYNDTRELHEINERTAAVIVEPIQAESGVTVPSLDFLKQLRDRCTATGTLLILDEIQTGFGRTGTLFAFQQLGIVPDVLLCAKGMGGGMPIGAFIASKEMMAVFQHGPILGHITTFGGHPVCCAASLATLQTLLAENYIAEVPSKEQLFKELLVHPAIRSFRSKGLLIALEFDSFETNKKIIDSCIENGVVTDWFLFAPNCLRIAPPLIITPEEIGKACKVVLAAIAQHTS